MATATREFTFRALTLGCFLGLIFGVGNAYLGLKVGTTVSASIPAAVMSMAILRTFFRNVSILENNMVQTIASVGEGLAAGVIFTAPALFLLGEAPSVARIFLLSFLGGILGILFMIPMRRYIIVDQHKELPFPEGTACAQILESGEKRGSQALLAISGIVIGALYKVAGGAFHLFREGVSWQWMGRFKTMLSIEATPALLGVGYIIGPRISSILFSGALLGWFVIIPLLASLEPASVTPEEIWANSIRYIGAGAVGMGGLISLFKIFPMIGKTFHAGFHELFRGTGHRKHLPLTDQDISLRWLVLGSIAIILLLWLFPGLPLNFVTIILLTVLGFFFVAVTSITVGLVGSTSNPVSGMTITTLLITCLVFVAIGWTERIYLVAALTMSIVANVAIAMAGTTSQDLKTGSLVGATPRRQQIGEMIGLLLPCLTIGVTLFLLNKAYTFGSAALPAPQGTLMAILAKGVMAGDIPYVLVSVGAILAIFIRILKLPVLPFALGLYLPLSLSTGIMAGGVVSAFLKRKQSSSGDARGILAASGLVAGDACTGVVIALFTIIGTINPDATPLLPNFATLALYLSLAYALYRVAK